MRARTAYASASRKRRSAWSIRSTVGRTHKFWYRHSVKGGHEFVLVDAYYFRINFDGTGLMRLTRVEANHNVSYSSDMTYYVDLYSRVDMAPVLVLHRVADRGLVAEIARGDLTALEAAGWKPPAVFTALGRDGKTDIWGVIYTPTTFDPAKKYPVVEQIYAGPQGSFVPKSFGAYAPPRARSRSWGLSSCRSMAWARRIDRRHSMVSRGSWTTRESCCGASMGLTSPTSSSRSTVSPRFDRWKNSSRDIHVERRSS
jgi:hypothetical protein